MNATALVALRADVKTAQRRLGHSDIRQTLDVYAQATDDADHAAAKRLGAHFLGDGTKGKKTKKGKGKKRKQSGEDAPPTTGDGQDKGS